MVFLKIVPVAGFGALDDSVNSVRQESMAFPIPGNPANLAKLAYIEFNPTGAATPVSGSSPSVLAITEGFVSGGGAPTPTASKTSSNTLANLTTISVARLVGRIQVARP